MKNKLKKIIKSKKTISIFMAIVIFAMTIGLPPYLAVSANNNTVLVLGSTNTITGTTTNGELTYKIGKNNAGTVRVGKMVNEQFQLLMPTTTGTTITYDLGNTNAQNIRIELQAQTGYQNPSNYNNGGNSMPLGTNQITTNLVGGISTTISFDFAVASGGNQNVNNVPQLTGTNITLKNKSTTVGNLLSVVDGNLVYKNGEQTVATVSLKVNDTKITPTYDANNYAIFNIANPTDNSYEADIQITPGEGYDLNSFFWINGMQDDTPGDGLIHATVNKDNTANVEIELRSEGGGELPQQEYPLVAYFSGVATGVDMDENAYFLMPDNWTKGTVTIKAKTCKVGGTTVPNNGQNVCDENSSTEESMNIVGISNGVQINETASSTPTQITIKDTCAEKYGKARFHIGETQGSSFQYTKLISIVSKDLINIDADAPRPLSQSFGTESETSALLTTANQGDTRIFFGNDKASLRITGEKTTEILSVDGHIKNPNINGKEVTFELYDLSQETTTPVKLKLKLTDNTIVTKTVNVVRTAIMLQHNYGDEDNSVYAGYVVNKGYLYNNKPHNDLLFNAYLQVILYKNDMVAGYKQIKINDEDLINKQLGKDQSGSLELYSPDQIPIYGKATNDLKDGINKVSVFLTNGPISYDKQLPSIEYGIGSGVTLEWGSLE